MTEWALAHPWLTFWLVLAVIQGIVHLVFIAVRHATVRKLGYPPAHCDADGDPINR